MPRISWYKILPPPTHASSRVTPSETAETVEKVRLHSGDDYTISIDGYKDGFIQSSLHIRRVSEENYGMYRCEAKNSEGGDDLDFVLERSSVPVDFSRERHEEKFGDYDDERDNKDEVIQSSSSGKVASSSFLVATLMFIYGMRRWS